MLGDGPKNMNPNRRKIAKLILHSPIFTLLLAYVAHLILEYIKSKRELQLQKNILATGRVDVSTIQCVLLSTENLLSLGRIEKRTLSICDIDKVIFNSYVRETIADAVYHTKDEYILRELSEMEKYYVLQNCVNHVSSLFATNYIEYNAIGMEHAEGQDAFQSTWYGLTLVLEHSEVQRQSQRGADDENDEGNMWTGQTTTMTNLRFTPQPTLKIVLVNETELRKIHDEKLQPEDRVPMFNARHHKRWKRLKSIADQFHSQLVTADPASKYDVGSGMQNKLWRQFAHSSSLGATPSPKMARAFASQRDDSQNAGGGSLRRIRSEGSCRDLSSAAASRSVSHDSALRSTTGATGDQVSSTTGLTNTFLRIHIPHHKGYSGIKRFR